MAPWKHYFIINMKGKTVSPKHMRYQILNETLLNGLK